ncbi:titin-like [Brachionus plicatilis]|uniref:Titin-like n=1 Tax=Brachionus plicatilis TaxID=10195 RepID=A0A3M7REZ7_BRAPC|nr:titin-like [Brachionus plicatilis]
MQFLSTKIGDNFNILQRDLIKYHSKVEWTRENQPLPHALRLSSDYLINEGRALFNIDNVKLDDQATYTLTARNSSGVASTSAKLKVKTVATIDDTSYVNPDVFEQFEMKKKPNWNQPIDNADNARLKIIEPLKDFRLVEGSQAVFSCTIDAYPKPEIQWFKDDQTLMASQRYATYYDMNMGIVTLIIKSALLDDQGVYKCVVSNIAGTEHTQAKLSVDFVPNIDETSYINPNALRHLQPAEQGQQPDDDDKYKKPYFVKVPKNLEVTDGSTVRLDCLAFGRPTPTLTWYFNDQQLAEDPTHKCLVNEEGVNSLLISPASFPDTGTYKCVARNKVGEASFTVDLKVVDKDALIAPYFIEHLNNIVIPEGKDTSLSCTCSGTPVPTLTWQKDAKVLTPDQEYRIDINGGHSKLYIQNAQKSDQGWYQCTAISPAGSTITRTKVTVLPPGAVQTMAPDLTKLIKQPVEPEVPGFVTALHKLKHVQPNKTPDERPKSPSDMPMGHNFGSIWSKDELQDEETIYNKDKPIPPKFKTHFKASLNLRERDPTRFEAKLIPIGDPTMTLQWLRNGEPLRSASRYVIKYDFGLVSLDLLWTYPEDDGVYECVATNSCGQDKTRAELKCKGNRSIIYDTQLPDGMEGYLKLQEMEEKIKIASILREEQAEDEAPESCAPEIIMHLEDNRVDEGTMAKFMVKVTGYPKPRVSWFVNKTHCVTNKSHTVILFLNN